MRSQISMGGGGGGGGVLPVFSASRSNARWTIQLMNISVCVGII